MNALAFGMVISSDVIVQMTVDIYMVLIDKDGFGDIVEINDIADHAIVWGNFDNIAGGVAGLIEFADLYLPCRQF